MLDKWCHSKPGVAWWVKSRSEPGVAREDWSMTVRAWCCSRGLIVDMSSCRRWQKMMNEIVKRGGLTIHYHVFIFVSPGVTDKYRSFSWNILITAWDCWYVANTCFVRYEVRGSILLTARGCWYAFHFCLCANCSAHVRTMLLWECGMCWGVTVTWNVTWTCVFTEVDVVFEFLKNGACKLIELACVGVLESDVDSV